MDLNYIARAKKFRAKKKLGQNFLISSEIIDFISDFAQFDDEVLEIGAGLGFVTEKLVKKVKNLVAVELDNDAVNILNKNFSESSNFTLIHGDILKTDITKLPFNADKIKVIANIPYYITSPILAHLLGEIDDVDFPARKKISEMFLMVQYEVALRITAHENSLNKEYGQLSILSQMYSDCEIVKKVPKKFFLPSPKVDSAIVKFSIHDKPKCPVTRLLKRTVKAIFSARRKNIKNSLLNAGFLGVEQSLNAVGIDKNDRGEKLPLELISKLSAALEEYN